MNVQTLTKNTFHEAVAHGVTLVDFYAPWCGPCKMQGPIVEQLAEETKQQATMAKVNTDQELDIADEFGIRSMPTLLFFKDGYLVDRLVGLQGKETLKRKIAEVAALGTSC